MHMRVLVYGVMALLVSLGLSACQSTDNGARRAAEVPSGPAAFIVAGRPVTVAQIQSRIDAELGGGVQQLVSQGQTREQIETIAREQNVFQTILDQIIQEELLAYEARRRGLGVDPDAVDAAMGQQDAPGEPLTPNDPAQLLNQRVRTARQQLVFAVITDQVRVDQFKSRHILVQTEAEANEIVELLKSGQSFAELARTRSQDPGSASNGGEYDWLPRGSFVPEYEQAVFNEQNALNTPIVVQSQFGYHVIEIEGRELNRRFDSFEQLRQNPNAQQLFSEQFLPWYEQYRKDAEANGTLKVLIDPASLTLPFPAGTP